MQNQIQIPGKQNITHPQSPYPQSQITTRNLSGAGILKQHLSFELHKIPAANLDTSGTMLSYSAPPKIQKVLKTAACNI